VLSFPVESAGALVDSFTMLPRVISPTRSANVAIGEDENILLALLREIEATAKMVTRGIRHTTLDSARRRQVRVAVVLELARLGRLQMMRAARAGCRHRTAARQASQSRPHGLAAEPDREAGWNVSRRRPGRWGSHSSPPPAPSARRPVPTDLVGRCFTPDAAGPPKRRLRSTVVVVNPGREFRRRVGSLGRPCSGRVVAPPGHRSSAVPPQGGGTQEFDFLHSYATRHIDSYQSRGLDWDPMLIESSLPSPGRALSDVAV
jgi:hypothetical protein